MHRKSNSRENLNVGCFFEVERTPLIMSTNVMLKPILLKNNNIDCLQFYAKNQLSEIIFVLNTM